MHAYSIPQPEKVKATVHVKDHNIKPIRIHTTVQEIKSINKKDQNWRTIYNFKKK